jgi:uncharacterized protein
MTRPIGAPCWLDLGTSDAEQGPEFYGRLFGWTAAEGSEQFGGYFMFMRDGVPVAGCMPRVPGMPGENLPDAWNVYLSVPDAKATVEAGLARGGELFEGPLEIADLGVEAILTDQVGARVGAWQAGTFPGCTVFSEPGTPAYFELITHDYAAAVEYYTDVFGWRGEVASDTDEFRLTVLKDGAEVIAGIMDGAGFLAPGEVPAWTVYFKVADTDATLARATSLGGTVTQPAMDTPYGRLAGLADPTGARFKLVG